MGCFVYIFLGTSKDVTLGPTAIMSLIVSSILVGNGVATASYPLYAVALCFLCGIVQLAMGLLNLGEPVGGAELGEPVGGAELGEPVGGAELGEPVGGVDLGEPVQ